MRWNLIQRMLAPFVRVCFLAFCNLAYATTQLVVSISSSSLILNILDNKYTSFFVTQSAYQRENEEPNQREQKKTAARTQKANQPASKQTSTQTFHFCFRIKYTPIYQLHIPCVFQHTLRFLHFRFCMHLK